MSRKIRAELSRPATIWSTARITSETRDELLVLRQHVMLPGSLVPPDLLEFMREGSESYTLGSVLSAAVTALHRISRNGDARPPLHRAKTADDVDGTIRPEWLDAAVKREDAAGGFQSAGGAAVRGRQPDVTVDAQPDAPTWRERSDAHLRDLERQIDKLTPEQADAEVDRMANEILRAKEKPSPTKRGRR